MQELSNRRDLTFYLQELLRILEGNESNDFSYFHSIRVDKNVPSFSKSEGSAVERLWRGKSRTIEIYIPSFKSSRWNEKKNKCGRKNKLQTWKKRNLTLIFNFFHDLVPETLWVFWQSDGYLRIANTWQFRQQPKTCYRSCQDAIGIKLWLYISWLGCL